MGVKSLCGASWQRFKCTLTILAPCVCVCISILVLDMVSGTVTAYDSGSH